MEANLIGQLAAIITACLWTFNSLFFTEAGKRIGSLSVNAYRLAMAVVLLVIAHIILLGSFLPVASSRQWFWIGMSGIIGLGIGDFGLFASYVIIGPRRSVLIMALSSIFAAISAFLILGETIALSAIIGMVITLGGIFWVILEQEEKSMEQTVRKRQKIWGICLALIGAIGQGIGLVLSKKGIFIESGIALNPLSTALIRMILGCLFVWVSVIFMRKLPEIHKALNNREGLKYTTAGAFIGPFIGVTLSMVAVTFTQAGVAQTLMSIMPVLIIPIIWIQYGQRTSWRGLIGAIITIIGVAILFLS